MDLYSIILYHTLQVAGFILALVLIVKIFKEKHGPASTLAWLFSFAMIPYIGVPLYLLIGGRKVRRMLNRKSALTPLPVTYTDGGIVEGNFWQAVPGIFPMRNAPMVTMLTDGQDSFTKLLYELENAKKSIYITTYVLKADETGLAIMEVLEKKAAQGVRVRLLVDGVGSFTFRKKHFRRLQQRGGKFAYFMPMFKFPLRGRANLRNHRKIVIVDSSTAIVGGMNLACEYLGISKDPSRWLDLSLVLNGPAVSDLSQVFYSDWLFASGEELPDESRQEIQRVSASETPVVIQVIPSGPDVAEDPLHDSILQHIFSATSRIFIVTPYFIPDEMIVKALCVAVRRGVEVRIVVPEHSNHPIADFVRRGYLRQMEAAGVKIYHYFPGMVHAKIIIIDDMPAIVGSMNVDMRSMFLNYEIALFIYSSDVSKHLVKWVESLMIKSRTGVRPSGPMLEFIEGIARLLAPLL